jgi:hypothetical protein
MARKNIFTFCKMFENVQFFSHLHLKYAKSAIMTQKNFFLKVSIWVSIWLSEMPLTKVKSKKPQKNAQKRKYSFRIAFWL